MRPRLTGRMGCQSGSITVELVALVPLLVFFVLLALALGRYEQVQSNLTESAGAAAAAAAVAESPTQARQAAVSTADMMLGASPRCSGAHVAVDTQKFSPGGEVRVTIECHVGFSDLSVPGMLGDSTVEATQVAPVDPYRAVVP